MREEEGRCGAGGRRGEGRCKGCKPLPFWRACGRAREERDEADAKGGGLFSPLPCRRRAARFFAKQEKTPYYQTKKERSEALFLRYRRHPKLFIAWQKKGRAEGRTRPEQNAVGTRRDEGGRKDGLSPLHIGGATKRTHPTARTEKRTRRQH